MILLQEADYAALAQFVDTVAGGDGNVEHFIVHTRKAVLGGLSPDANRKASYGSAFLYLLFTKSYFEFTCDLSRSGHSAIIARSLSLFFFSQNF